MTKIQIIHRTDGTDVCVLYVPADVARSMDLKKGDSVDVTYEEQLKAITVKRTA